MSVEDYEHHRTSILTHEQEHIRLHHTYDLILLEVVKTLQWFNPFVWFLASNLKSVHEYEADEAVINQGIDAIQYQQLLVTKAVGNRLQPFANNLRRGSLKKRIIMMYQKKSNRWMMLKALFVIPVVLIAILAFATPKFVSSIKDTVEERNPSQTPDNKNTTEVADTCDAEIGIYLLTPEKIANLNETPEDSFLLDGKHISFEKFKKLDMDSIEHVGILAKSEESRDKQISGECKGRTFYVISKKMGISRYSKIEIRVNRQDKIMLGTDIVNLSNLSDSIKKQVSSPDRTIVSLEVSEKAPQSTVSSIKEILRKTGNLNIEYSVHKESDK
ncbi:MAG: M56 family metallopeptidase [Bacteroidaceae bacterium]|nr:M56 family metallopeptidase [Bacteroidaceae bacterium]